MALKRRDTVHFMIHACGPATEKALGPSYDDTRGKSNILPHLIHGHNNNNSNVRLFNRRHNTQSTVATSAMQGDTRLYTERLSSAKLLPHTAQTG